MKITNDEKLYAGIYLMGLFSGMIIGLAIAWGIYN